MVVYDNLPKYCICCNHQGHAEETCRWKIDEIEDGVVDAAKKLQVNGLAALDKFQGDAREHLNSRQDGQLETETAKETVIEQHGVQRTDDQIAIMNADSDKSVGANVVNDHVEETGLAGKNQTNHVMIADEDDTTDAQGMNGRAPSVKTTGKKLLSQFAQGVKNTKAGQWCVVHRAVAGIVEKELHSYVVGPLIDNKATIRAENEEENQENGWTTVTSTKSNAKQFLNLSVQRADATVDGQLGRLTMQKDAKDVNLIQNATIEGHGDFENEQMAGHVAKEAEKAIKSAGHAGQLCLKHQRVNLIENGYPMSEGTTGECFEKGTNSLEQNDKGEGHGDHDVAGQLEQNEKEAGHLYKSLNSIAGHSHGNAAENRGDCRDGVAGHVMVAGHGNDIGTLAEREIIAGHSHGQKAADIHISAHVTENVEQIVLKFAGHGDIKNGKHMAAGKYLHHAATGGSTDKGPFKEVNNTIPTFSKVCNAQNAALAGHMCSENGPADDKAPSSTVGEARLEGKNDKHDRPTAIAITHACGSARAVSFHDAATVGVHQNQIVEFSSPDHASSVAHMHIDRPTRAASVDENNPAVIQTSAIISAEERNLLDSMDNVVSRICDERGYESNEELSTPEEVGSSNNINVTVYSRQLLVNSGQKPMRLSSTTDLLSHDRQLLDAMLNAHPFEILGRDPYAKNRSRNEVHMQQQNKPSDVESQIEPNLDAQGVLDIPNQ